MSTALYDSKGRFLGHSIEVEHATVGSRAWCLDGLGEWCYPSVPCDSCQRARKGDPWEILEDVRRMHHADASESTCEHCHRRWPCPTRRLIDGE